MSPKLNELFGAELSDEELQRVNKALPELISEQLMQVYRMVQALLSDGSDFSEYFTRRLALSELLGKQLEKGNMTSNALSPELIQDAIRKGHTLLLSPVAHDPNFMSVEARETFGPENGRDAAWLEAHKSDLLKQYEGQFIAILDCEVIGTGDDFEKLHNSLDPKYHEKNVFIIKVTKEALSEAGF
ncbi:DUF5678 domain-containing protein [Patescibacteria group bacterium]